MSSSPLKERLPCRARSILCAVIEDYIHTALPVSSKRVASSHMPDKSPATIRGLMAELEREGYLYQPHTSAGRIPTEKGFKTYVDEFLRLEGPEEDEKERIRSACASTAGIESMMRDTSRALSLLTGRAGIIVYARAARFVIRHIRLVPVDRNTVMMVIVSRRGLLGTRLVRTDEDMMRLDLEQAANYLNEVAGGLTLEGLRERVAEEMRSEKNLYDELLCKTLKIASMALDRTTGDGAEIFVEGKANVMEQPEFSADVETMKRLFKAFEEKSLLLKLLDRGIESRGVHMSLGSECTSELDGLGSVAAPYGTDGETAGALAVIGPVRMDYSRIIPLVDYAAAVLGRAISGEMEAG